MPVRTREGDRMANQATTQEQHHGLARRGGYNPFEFTIAAGDFFRTSPFSLMRKITEEMDRAFHEYVLGGGTSAWAPAIEISERDGRYVVRAELPGVKPGDVKLEMTDDALVLQGERRREHEATEGSINLT